MDSDEEFENYHRDPRNDDDFYPAFEGEWHRSKKCPVSKETKFHDHEMVEYRLESRNPHSFYGPDLSDVCLVAEGVEFHVHKMVLAVHSTYFKGKFDPESKEKDEKRLEIDADPTYLNAILEVVYKGKQEDLTYLRLKCGPDRSAKAACRFHEPYKSIFSAFWTNGEGLWKIIDDFDLHHVKKYFAREIQKNACEPATGRYRYRKDCRRVEMACSYTINHYLFARLPEISWEDWDDDTTVNFNEKAFRKWLVECSRFLPDSVPIAGKLFQEARLTFDKLKENWSYDEESPSPGSLTPMYHSDDSESSIPEAGDFDAPKAKKARVEATIKEKPRESRSYLCPELSDVCLVVGGVDFHVHKMLLASQSPYFYALFFSNFVERHKKQIEIDADPIAFHSLMQAIYHISLSDSEFLICISCRKSRGGYSVIPDREARAVEFWQKAASVRALIDRFDMPYIKEYFEKKLFKNKKRPESYYSRSNCCGYCLNHDLFAVVHGFQSKNPRHIGSINIHKLDAWLEEYSKLLPESIRVSGHGFQFIVSRFGGRSGVSFVEYPSDSDNCKGCFRVVACHCDSPDDDDESTDQPPVQHVGEREDIKSKPRRVTRSFLNDDTSDLCLTVGNVDFNVHRMILSIHAAYFRKLFFPANGEENLVQQMELDADPEHFHSLMEIIYHGRLSDTRFLECSKRAVRRRRQFWKRAEGIWKMAERFEVPYAKEWLGRKVAKFACDPGYNEKIFCSACVNHYIFADLHGITLPEENPSFVYKQFFIWMKKYSRFVPEEVSLSGPIVQKIFENLAEEVQSDEDGY